MSRPRVASHDQKPDRGVVSGIKSPPLARTLPPPHTHGIYIDRCIITPFVIWWPDLVTFYAQKWIFSENCLGTLRYPFTVKLTKPWTPEIFMECYCVARNKPIRHEITKPQTAMVISLWSWGLLVRPELYCDWPVHNRHSWNFSGVHGFLTLTVIAPGNFVEKHF